MPQRWRMLALLFVARCALGFQFQSAASAGPAMVADLGISFAELGILIGMHTAPGILMALPGGLIGSRLGDKRGVLIGLVLMTAGSLLAGLGGSFQAALIGRALAGTGSIFLSVLMTKATTDWFEGRELVTALSILFASWPVGIGIALPVVGSAAALHGWAAGLLLPAGLSGAGLILIALFYREHRGPGGAAPALDRWGESGRELLLATLGGVVWSLYNQPALLIQGFAPAFLAERGTDAAGAGALISLSTWTFLPAMLAGGWLGQRFGRPNLFIVGCCLPLALVMLALPPAGAGAVPILFALAGILTGAPTGVVMALPAELLKPGARAVGMGVFYTWPYIGMAATPAVAGWLRDRTGSGDAPFLFGAALALAAIGALAAVRLVDRR
jgi:MFS family permease